MKTSLRLVLLACAGLAGLAFAGPALADYRPSFLAEQTSYKLGRATTVDNFFAVPRDDDATAKITFFSPARYGVNLGQAVGTRIGSVVAVVKAKALANALLPLSGDVVVANPADPTIAAQSAQCTGSAANQAVWLLNATLTQTNTTIPIPVFVNKVGPLATLQVCFRSPDVPPPTGSPSGIQLVAAEFSVRGVFTNASARGGYEWSAVFTPYRAGTAVPNVAGTAEWRTYVGLPQSLTFKRVKSRNGVKFTGTWHVEGVRTTNIRLRLYSGKKSQPAPNAVSLGTGKFVARTRPLTARGKYSITRARVKIRTFFQMRFESYATDCTTPSPSPIPVPRGCLGEWLAPMTSSQIRVLPAKKRR
jgi:hypothetical protein